MNILERFLPYEILFTPTSLALYFISRPVSMLAGPTATGVWTCTGFPFARLELICAFVQHHCCEAVRLAIEPKLKYVLQSNQKLHGMSLGVKDVRNERIDALGWLRYEG